MKISPQPSRNSVLESLLSYSLSRQNWNSYCKITDQLRSLGHRLPGTNCDFVLVNSLFPYNGWTSYLTITSQTLRSSFITKPSSLLLFGLSPTSYLFCFVLAVTSLSQFSPKMLIKHFFTGFMFNIEFMLGTMCCTNA